VPFIPILQSFSLIVLFVSYRKATLSVDRSHLANLDLILFTAVEREHKRQEDEKAAARSAGGGGGP